MAGPNRKRAAHEKAVASSSGGQSSSGKASSHHQTETRSTPISLPRYDGNRDAGPSSTPVGAITTANLRRLEMSFGMWAAYRGSDISTTLPSRPSKPNAQGRETTVQLNTFNVLSYPKQKVYQYDVQIMQGKTPVDDKKRTFIKKVWHSKAIQGKIGQGWLYDGNKLAWSLKKLDDQETRIDVDLSAEAGKKSSDRNKATIYLRQTKELKFDILSGYLQRQHTWDRNTAAQFLECLSFLDHLLRELPSQRYTMIKKSFFQRGQNRFLLSANVEAMKGAFASMRIVNNYPHGALLSVNVDVANGTFFCKMDLIDHIKAQLNAKDDADVQRQFRDARNEKTGFKNSAFFKKLKPLQKLKVEAKHREAEFTIKRFVDKDPTEHKFDKDGKQVSVARYFQLVYNKSIRSGFPLVETNRGEYLPIEALKVPENQRYPFKLDPVQTSKMIKFAVTLPNERWQAVQHGLQMFDWGNDRYLQQFGLKIDPNPAKVKARILPTPDINFGQGKVSGSEAVRGRWRIDGKRFLTINSKPLRAWGFCVVKHPKFGRESVNQQAAQAFCNKFIEVYKSHGGVFESTNPAIFVGDPNKGGEMIVEAWNTTGGKFKQNPQLIFFVLPEKPLSDLYQRIKKSCECRYGIPSQILQAEHVMKCQAQYISNVCMKVNAKLGGSTCRAIGNVLPKVQVANAGSIPTMIIAADVSHASPGSDAGSMCAISASMDVNFTKYMALCQTNGYRVEIITTQNIEKLLGEMLRNWMGVFNGRLPQRVLYIRDGVSEGQYQFVLDQEVRDMKALCRSINSKVEPTFTVVIAAKRHHIRFFPTQGGQADKNGNPLPGTLVETGCTHPYEFDWYLNSHVALKGTSRPVHYHVLANDKNAFNPEELQQVIFEHSFQYARATTPVSLHPAVYYAHLASKRAGAFVQQPQVSSGKKEEGRKAAEGSQTSGSVVPEIAPLLDLNNNNGLKYTMWYI